MYNNVPLCSLALSYAEPSTFYLLLICTPFKHLTFFEVMIEMLCTAKCLYVLSQVSEHPPPTPQFQLVLKTMEVWSETAPTMLDLRDTPSGYTVPLVVVPQKHYKDPKSRREEGKYGGGYSTVCIESKSTVAWGCSTDPGNSCFSYSTCCPTSTGKSPHPSY